MRDRYGREIDYLRISVTDKCNLRCKYCMPGDIESIPMGKILSFEEITYIAGRAAELGISRLRIKQRILFTNITSNPCPV